VGEKNIFKGVYCSYGIHDNTIYLFIANFTYFDLESTILTHTKDFCGKKNLIFRIFRKRENLIVRLLQQDPIGKLKYKRILL
jgi:hypothetical protein